MSASGMHRGMEHRRKNLGLSVSRLAIRLLRQGCEWPCEHGPCSYRAEVISIARMAKARTHTVQEHIAFFNPRALLQAGFAAVVIILSISNSANAVSFETPLIKPDSGPWD